MMSQLSIEVPPDILSLAKQTGARLPASTVCEVFRDRESGSVCYVCNTAALAEHDDSLFAVVAFRSTADAPLTRMGDMLRQAHIKMPKIKVSQVGEITLLRMPWLYRGELRTLAARAMVRDNKEPPGPRAFVNGYLEVSAVELERQLQEFISGYDSLFKQVLRRQIRSAQPQSQKWGLPLGCTVNEEVWIEGVTWDVCFEDADILERANMLLEARMAAITPKHVTTVHVTAEEGPTVIQGVRLASQKNSHIARIEMAGILKHLINSLDQFNFQMGSRPADISSIFS